MPRSATKVTKSTQAYLTQKNQQALELEERLHSQQQQQPDGVDRVNPLRVPLCEILSDLLLTSPKFAVENNVIHRLWHDCFYTRIGPQRARISREQRKRQQQQIQLHQQNHQTQQQQHPNQHQQQQQQLQHHQQHIEKLEKSYSHFLVEAITLYVYLADQLQTKLTKAVRVGEGSHDDDDEVDDEMTQTEQSSMTTNMSTLASNSVTAAGTNDNDPNAMVECLYGLQVHLGDLYRYADNLSRAEISYQMASRLAPGHGHAYNQLAVLCQVRDLQNANNNNSANNNNGSGNNKKSSSPSPPPPPSQAVVALSWYARSLVATHRSFVTSQVNVVRLMNTNREWLTTSSSTIMQQQSNSSSKEQKSIQSRLFLSRWVDLYFTFLLRAGCVAVRDADAAASGGGGNGERIVTGGAGDEEHIGGGGSVDEDEGVLAFLSHRTTETMDSFASLLRQSALGDGLLCRLVTIAAFCETYMFDDNRRLVTKDSTGLSSMMVIIPAAASGSGTNGNNNGKNGSKRKNAKSSATDHPEHVIIRRRNDDSGSNNNGNRFSSGGGGGYEQDGALLRRRLIAISTARVALLRMGQLLAERVLTGLATKLQQQQQQQQHLSQSQATTSMSQQQQQVPKLPLSIRWLLPLLLLSEYLQQCPFPEPPSSEMDSLVTPMLESLSKHKMNAIHTSRHEAERAFWIRIVDVLNHLHDVVGGGSSDLPSLQKQQQQHGKMGKKNKKKKEEGNRGQVEAPVVEEEEETTTPPLTEYQNLRGFGPFQSFLSPLTPTGFVTDREALDVLELEKRGGNNNNNTQQQQQQQQQHKRKNSSGNASTHSMTTNANMTTTTSTTTTEPARIKVSRFLAFGRRLATTQAGLDGKIKNPSSLSSLGQIVRKEDNRFAWIDHEKTPAAMDVDNDDDGGDQPMQFDDILTKVVVDEDAAMPPPSHRGLQKVDGESKGKKKTKSKTTSTRKKTATKDDEDDGGDEILVYKEGQSGGPALLVPGALLQQNFASGASACGTASSVSSHDKTMATATGYPEPLEDNNISGRRARSNSEPMHTVLQSTASADVGIGIAPSLGGNPNISDALSPRLGVVMQGDTLAAGLPPVTAKPAMLPPPPGFGGMAMPAVTGAQMASTPLMQQPPSSLPPQLPPGFGQVVPPEISMMMMPDGSSMTPTTNVRQRSPTVAESFHLFGGPSSLQTANPFVASTAPPPVPPPSSSSSAFSAAATLLQGHHHEEDFLFPPPSGHDGIVGQGVARGIVGDDVQRYLTNHHNQTMSVQGGVVSGNVETASEDVRGLDGAALLDSSLLSSLLMDDTPRKTKNPFAT